MAKEAALVSHVIEVKAALKSQLATAATIIGGKLESNAKTEISSSVYNTPASWYTRTGRLRNSITHKTEDESHGVDIIVGTNVEYAPYVELGTGILAEKGDGRKTPWTYLGSDGKFHTTTGMSPRPYLRPAVEDHADEYKRVVEQCLKD